MSTNEVEQLRANVEALETCIQSLVVLLHQKGVIKREEWSAMNFEVYDIQREQQQ